MKKLRLCHTPTPVWRNAALDALLGFELWVKRDDMTAGAAAGNKIRKLEYLLAEALERGATCVITCGGEQSNHARSTALLARELGLSCALLLRKAEAATPPREGGNLLLDRMVGADISFISPAQYRERAVHLQRTAEQLAGRGMVPYVIPEGGSNGLGAFGYVDAVKELAEQQAAGALPPDLDLVACACGSGGTAAGLALGLGQFPGVARRVVALAVCDDRLYFERAIAAIEQEARGLRPQLLASMPLEIRDEFKGPAYGVPSREQLEFMLRVARVSGLVLDPTYTAKALYGLSRLTPRPRRALFIHSGGLPGLLAEPELIAGAWAPAAADS